MPSTAACPLAAPTLDAAAIARFHEHGYHILPAFLAEDRIETLKREVDAFIADQAAPVDPYAPAGINARKLQLEYQEHGLLLSDPALVAVLSQLMAGSRFTFHHLHTARHDPGCGGVSWHHDYEQMPQTNRSHLMVHVFYYLNGLNGEIGDLLLLPGSHQRIMERNAMGSCGTGVLPGELVIDDVPPGTAIIVHSAALHARRAKPGGAGRSRYFIDSSYCQAGVQWPSYGPDRPDAMMARALARGLGRGGATDFLFDASAFFGAAEGRQRLSEHRQGSLALSFPLPAARA